VSRKNIPVPHIPLKFEEAIKEFLKVKPPKKEKPKRRSKSTRRPTKRQAEKE
jgi:hypothetical protein